MSDKIDKNEIVLVSVDRDFGVQMEKLARTEMPIKILGRKWLVQHLSTRSSPPFQEVRVELIEIMVRKKRR